MTILIDLDSVVATKENTIERAAAAAATRPIPGAREAMRKLADDGHTLIVRSSRAWSELRMIKAWLDDHEIPHHGIHLGMPVADCVIDDRAINLRDWNTAMHHLAPDAHATTVGGGVDEALLRMLRAETRAFLHAIAARADLLQPVLEVGPMTQAGAASGVFARMPETFVDSPRLFGDAGMEYVSLDIDPSANPTKVGDLTMADKLFPPASIGTAVLLSCLEHVTRVWDVPRVLQQILKPGGRAFMLTPWNLRFHGPRPDCWRISDDGYRALFSDGFEIESLEQVECPGRPLMPVGMKCVVRKRA